MDHSADPQLSGTPTTTSGTAIVTGAAGAVGRATVAALSARGFRVIAVDRSEALPATFSDRPTVTSIVADMSGEVGVEAVMNAIGPALGEVRVLVNNAGVLSNNKVEQTSYQEWRSILAVNLDAAFLMARACVPSMRRNGYGRIVNMCSLAMKTGGLTAGTAYTVSKGALASLTFSLARELAPSGITVNAIAPAYVRSPMVMDQLDDNRREAVLAAIPVGRLCEPEEIAHAIDFLVSPLSGFITGEILDVNGGLHFD